MRLLMLRHGQTAGNAARVYVGAATDEPLSAEGRRQCLAAGCDPNVMRVYTSGMVRADQTARALFPAAELVPVPDLREFDFGVFEGRSADKMSDDPLYRAWVESGCEDACPEGDTRVGYTERVSRSLCRLLVAAQDAREDMVVVVAHGGTVMAAMSSFVEEGCRRGYFDWYVPNCAGLVCDVGLGGEAPVLRDPQLVTRLPV